jgi:hypothetical protein
VPTDRTGLPFHPDWYQPTRPWPDSQKEIATYPAGNRTNVGRSRPEEERAAHAILKFAAGGPNVEVDGRRLPPVSALSTPRDNSHNRNPAGVGVSVARDGAAAAREAVTAALAGHRPAAGDLVLLFASADYPAPALHDAAVAAAAPAQVVGCTSTGGFTCTHEVPRGCVAALIPARERSFGICHVHRDEADLAGSAQRAVETARERAGARHANSVLLLLTDGLTPDQREIARGAYQVTGARVPFVGGAAADDLRWRRTYTLGEGRTLTDGILAVWINSAQPVAVSVGHGWRPRGRPMLVTRAAGTVVRELDGIPALSAYLGQLDREVDPTGPDFFHEVLSSPVGLPNARGQYDVRQLHAYLPPGGGLNFNTAISEHTVLQVMTADQESLLDGARAAARQALEQLPAAPSLALVFSCGSRLPLLRERMPEEATAISSALGGAPLCGFFTYGEFARVNGSSGVHNSSVAILAL